MNILLVSQYFWPENFRINDLAVYWQQQGHRVTVLTGIPNYPAGRYFDGYGLFRNTVEQWQGIEIIRVPQTPRGKGGGIRLSMNYLSFAFCASLFGPFRVPKDFDVIFVHEPSPITVGIPAIVMKIISGKPILFWVLDLWPDSVAAVGAITHPRIIGLLGRLTRWIYSYCDLVLLQSRGFIYHARAMSVPKQRIRYFPSWAEELYAPLDTSMVAKPDLPNGFKVMFAGNIGAAQDFGTLLKAAEILKMEDAIKWVIIGDGRMLPWLRDEVHRLGLERTVHLLGRHPVEKMPEFFAYADVLLVTLKKEPIFSNTIPGKIQSYLASAKPILAMLDGEGAKIVNQAKAGITCPAENAEALAKAALKLSKLSRHELAAMGRNGRDYYETNFDRKKMFPLLERWMNELINRNTGGDA